MTLNTGDCLIEVTSWAGLTVILLMSPTLLIFDMQSVKQIITDLYKC